MKVIVFSLLSLLFFHISCSASIDGGGRCADDITGNVGLEVNVSPDDMGTYYISKVQFAMVSQLNESEWTASQPFWYDQPENLLNWNITIQPLMETGLSSYHNKLLTAVTWTAPEPLLMKPYPNFLEFWINMQPGKLSRDWAVFRIWDGSGNLVRISDFAPLVDPATDIPEPSSLIALLGGLAGIGGIPWRRRK